jgi:hypothetical protein
MPRSLSGLKGSIHSSIQALSAEMVEQLTFRSHTQRFDGRLLDDLARKAY